MCINKISHFLTLEGLTLTPGPKFTKRGDDLLPKQVYNPAKFHPPASTHARDIRYKKSADKHSYAQTNKQ